MVAAALLVGTSCGSSDATDPIGTADVKRAFSGEGIPLDSSPFPLPFGGVEAYFHVPPGGGFSDLLIGVFDSVSDAKRYEEQAGDEILTTHGQPFRVVERRRSANIILWISETADESVRTAAGHAMNTMDRSD